AQALLRRPRALAATRVGRGGEQRPVAVAQRPWAGGRSAGDKRLLRGASLCREPLQYRHIASGSPPRPASHISSVAQVPIYETGSNHDRATQDGDGGIIPVAADDPFQTGRGNGGEDERRAALRAHAEGLRRDARVLHGRDTAARAGGNGGR